MAEEGSGELDAQEIVAQAEKHLRQARDNQEQTPQVPTEPSRPDGVKSQPLPIKDKANMDSDPLRLLSGLLSQSAGPIVALTVVAGIAVLSGKTDKTHTPIPTEVPTSAQVQKTPDITKNPAAASVEKALNTPTAFPAPEGFGSLNDPIKVRTIEELRRNPAAYKEKIVALNGYLRTIAAEPTKEAVLRPVMPYERMFHLGQPLIEDAYDVTNVYYAFQTTDFTEGNSQEEPLIIVQSIRGKLDTTEKLFPHLFSTIPFGPHQNDSPALASERMEVTGVIRQNPETKAPVLYNASAKSVS